MAVTDFSPHMNLGNNASSWTDNCCMLGANNVVTFSFLVTVSSIQVAPRGNVAHVATIPPETGTEHESYFTYYNRTKEIFNYGYVHFNGNVHVVGVSVGDVCACAMTFIRKKDQQFNP